MLIVFTGSLTRLTVWLTWLGERFKGGFERVYAMKGYLLVFDPVEVRVLYASMSPLFFEEGEPAALVKVIFSSFDLPSGARAVRELARKWYRVDVKLLAAVAPRYAAEQYAPVYVAKLPPACSATVDMLWGVLNVVWGAPVEERAPAKGAPGSLRVVPLFKGVEDVKDFLEGQAVFAAMLKAALTAKVLRVEEVAQAVADAYEAAADAARAVVSRVPSSLELVERVLSKFNVAYKDVVDFAASEEVARRLVARLKEMVGAAGGGGAGGGGA